MKKKYFILLNLIVISSSFSFQEFKEITPFENLIMEREEIVIDERKKEEESLESIQEKKAEDATLDNKNDGENFSVKSQKQQSDGQIEVKEEVNEIISNNSIPLITEEQLSTIIEKAKQSPIPENTIEYDRDILTLNLNKSYEISDFDIINDFKKTLDKYKFSNKSDDIHVGHITSKEYTTDSIVKNLEFGVGIAYKDGKSLNTSSEYLLENSSDSLNYTPIYATGKYKISENEENSKYLKINLGYAVSSFDSYSEREYDENREQSGIYYGIGGSVEFQSLSFDLIYQVNKDGYQKKSGDEDDSKITLSVDYKLDL